MQTLTDHQAVNETIALSATFSHFLNTFRERDFITSLGSLFQYNPFHEEIPDLQPELALGQLETMLSHPATDCLGADTNLHLAAASFQILVGCDKVTPEPPFLG